MKKTIKTSICISADSKFFNDDIDFIDERRGQAGLSAAISSKDNRQRNNRNKNKKIISNNLKSSQPTATLSIGASPTFKKDFDEKSFYIEENKNSPQYYNEPLMQAIRGDAYKDFNKNSVLSESFIDAISKNVSSDKLLKKNKALGTVKSYK